MGTGYIQDFSKPNPNPPEGQRQIDRGIQVVGGGAQAPTENPGPDAPEITLHPEASTRLFERVVTEEDQLRATVREPNDPEVVVRDGISQIEWRDKVKRDDDE